MAYHEAYRVGVATAAPVIALANTVSITDVIGAWFESTAQQRSYSSKLGYFTVLFASASNLIIQAALLFVALDRLLDESDGSLPLLAAFFLFEGLIYLLLIFYSDIRLRYILRRDESAEKKTNNETVVNEASLALEADTNADKKMSGLGWPIDPPSS